MCIVEIRRGTKVIETRKIIPGKKTFGSTGTLKGRMRRVPKGSATMNTLTLRGGKTRRMSGRQRAMQH